MSIINDKLALLGGTPALQNETIPEALFRWPVRGEAEDKAVLDVLHRNAISGNDVTTAFEKEFAAWNNRQYCVACCNGTMALQTAMFALGLKAGDEIICPTITYWASCLSAQTLGLTVVFANADPKTVGIDPTDLERCLSPYTKAIMVVHYWAYPCDMDAIMAFAKKHNLKVIEDVSHAQGGTYKGRKLGTFGDVSAMSLMSCKSFSCGELGVVITDTQAYYEKALAYLHYERNNDTYIDDGAELSGYHYLPLSGMKGRANQMCTALGREVLKTYDERTRELRRGINYFWDQMEGVPGIHAHRVDERTGSTMGGWYVPHMLYNAEELGGLPLWLLVKAVTAETNLPFHVGTNNPLHTHPMFQTYDALGLGKPSRIAFAHRDVRELDKDLARSEHIQAAEIPYFRAYIPEAIDKYVAAYRKVVSHYEDLLKVVNDYPVPPEGEWYGKVR